MIATTEVLSTTDWATIMFASYWKKYSPKLKNKKQVMAAPFVYQKVETIEPLVAEAVVQFAHSQQRGRDRKNFQECLVPLELTLDFVELIVIQHLFANTNPSQFGFFYKMDRT